MLKTGRRKRAGAWFAGRPSVTLSLLILFYLLLLASTSSSLRSSSGLSLGVSELSLGLLEPGGPAGEEKTPPRDAVGRVRHGDGARGCCWCWCRVFVDVRSWAHGRYFGYQATKLWTPNIRTENAILDRKNNLGRTRLESQRRSEFSADFKSVEKRVCPLHFVGVNTRNDRPLIYE